MAARPRQRLLVIGSGGREHALASALARSPRAERVLVCPGNGGMDLEVVPGIAVTDVRRLVELARAQRIDLTVVGPEAPLAAGIADAFAAAGLRCLGPTAAGARLESSKADARAFMQRAGIPTPRWRVFDDVGAALAHLREVGPHVVIKASGLAAGKGVVLPAGMAEAERALDGMMVERCLGAAGDRIVIEERVDGVELSLLALCDGQRALLLPPAQDHKRLNEGDRGPNTGGMGACAPVPVDAALLREIEQRVFQPALDLLRAAGTPYVGVLYAGLMLTATGPLVLEFNCRFGDPELQAVLPLLADDLLDLLDACTDGDLPRGPLRLNPGAAATVVLAASGYPERPRPGDPIEGVAEAMQLPGVTVHHAGSARRGDRLVTAGGRVLDVTGVGADLMQALERAYQGVAAIRFAGMQYRRDIGARTPGRPA